MSSFKLRDEHLITDDNVKLHYIEATFNDGEEETTTKENDNILLLLPGWSQTAAMFRNQFELCNSSRRRVIALDPRGHGESDKAPTGYRLSRLAKDVHCVIQHLTGTTTEVVLDVLAHSASCAVMWNYVELYGNDRSSKSGAIRSLIFYDQILSYIKHPSWSDEECLRYGAVATGNDVVGFVDGLAQLNKTSSKDDEVVDTDDEAYKFTQTVLSGMLSDEVPKDTMDWVVRENLKFPRPLASQMIWNVMTLDARDMMTNVALQVENILCIGAQDSNIPHPCMTYMTELINKNSNKKADCVILPATNKHFAFLENPNLFNSVVTDFLDRL